MHEAFDKSIDSFDRRVLMDGCRRQNSKEALKALEDVSALVFKIPPRSPDFNPIETFLLRLPKHFVSKSSKRTVCNEGTRNNAEL